MKNTVSITLIICGTLLIITPYMHTSLATEQVAVTMMHMQKDVNIKTDLPESAYTYTIIIGSLMVLTGTIISLKTMRHLQVTAHQPQSEI